MERVDAALHRHLTRHGAPPAGIHELVASGTLELDYGNAVLLYVISPSRTAASYCINVPPSHACWFISTSGRGMPKVAPAHPLPASGKYRTD